MCIRDRVKAVQVPYKALEHDLVLKVCKKRTQRLRCKFLTNNDTGRTSALEVFVQVLIFFSTCKSNDLCCNVCTELLLACAVLDININTKPVSYTHLDVYKRQMGRRTSKQELIDIVGKLRKEIPDIVLRTTLITGFPGETEEDHEELKEFVDEMEFDRLGVFTYSPEENTPAAEMADQIPEEVKEERRDELMELQQEISYDRGQDRIGQELLVMIEGKVADESAYIGRTYGDAPKVDGYIFVQTGELLMTGDFAKVRVTGALEYDLIGVLSDEYTE